MRKEQAVDPGSVQRFRELVAERLGFDFNEDQPGAMEHLLRERAGETCSGRIDSYLDGLEQAGTWSIEQAPIAQALTIQESHFFRVPDHFRAFREVVVPDRLRRSGRLRILSAGCAGGEEAYTLAITLIETLGVPNAEIFGADVNLAAIAKARQGRFGTWSLRQTPDEVCARYFEKRGGELFLLPKIREMVSFIPSNLLDPEAEIWGTGKFDVIFCRNVSIYFSREATRSLIARLADALAPGGYLFLGHSETLRGISEQFDVVQSHDTFYYQLRSQTPRLAVAVMPAQPAPQRPHAETYIPPRRRPTDELELAVALAERGDVAGVVQVADRLLDCDALDAAAHHLKALCAEHTGDLATARNHDLDAVRADPDFAIAWFHLGVLARRSGDVISARRQLARALVLLTTEDEAVIRLFGGGFLRDGLTEMCRAELARCGGTR